MGKEMRKEQDGEDLVTVSTAQIKQQQARDYGR